MSATRGQVLANRYRLVRQVTTAGWEAYDLTLDRRVSMELLGQQPTSSTAETFWRDARAAARTGAPDRPKVLDAGTDAGTGLAFLVREWREQPEPTPPAPEGAAARQRIAAPDRAWRPGRWLVASGIVAALVVVGSVTGAGVSAWLAWINEPFGQQKPAFSLAFPPKSVQVPSVGAQPGQPTATPAAPPPTVAPAARATTPATPTPAAQATPTATATLLGSRRRIVNTDGAGVALRSGPGGDRLRGKGYDEGVIVTVLERNGPWTHIRGDDGRDGWIPSVTVAP